MLKIYKDGGGRGALNLEVERWPGVVREVGGEPIGMKEWTAEEKKVLFIHYSLVITLITFLTPTRLRI